MLDSTTPLVSILMPAFNASETINFALASLMAQSYQNWECIIVDDGSTDQTVELIKAIPDPRIKLSLLGKNYGRGIARQKSLELAQGKYITMLDADDWLYPDKIAFQVGFLEKNPEVVLHSMAMAIVDGDEIVSVRRAENDIDRNLNDLHKIFIPHAPSMIRYSCIGDVTYDSRFKLAQDQDFLRRVLVGKRYYVSTKVGYCYSEVQSVNIRKIIKGYFYNSRGYLKLFPHFKHKALKYFILEVSKIPYTLVIFLAKGERHIIDSRSKITSVKDIEEFRISIKKIKDALVNKAPDKGLV